MLLDLGQPKCCRQEMLFYLEISLVVALDVATISLYMIFIIALMIFCWLLFSPPDVFYFFPLFVGVFSFIHASPDLHCFAFIRRVSSSHC